LHDPRTLKADWPYLLTYTTNFGRLRPSDIGEPFTHLWSLAVEEQFYLLWPLVVSTYANSMPLAAGLATRCTIQLAYAIGVSEPLSLYVDTHGTGTVGDDAIESAIGKIDKLGRLTPRGIRTHLGLNKPIYGPTAAYGHFGRKSEGDYFPWERVDLVDDLKTALAA